MMTIQVKLTYIPTLYDIHFIYTISIPEPITIQQKSIENYNIAGRSSLYYLYYIHIFLLHIYIHKIITMSCLFC